MTDERLEEIRYRLSGVQYIGVEVGAELLAEVDRLRVFNRGIRKITQLELPPRQLILEILDALEMSP